MMQQPRQTCSICNLPHVSAPEWEHMLPEANSWGLCRCHYGKKTIEFPLNRWETEARLKSLEAENAALIGRVKALTEALNSACRETLQPECRYCGVHFGRPKKEKPPEKK